MSSAFDADQLRRGHPLSEYLPARGIAVKPEGREFRCLCPFHAERTPSFQIYRGRKGTQEFHCKGCDAKGDVIGFVERYDGATFAEACEILGGTREPTENRPAVAPAEPAPDIYAAWKPRVPDESAPRIEAGKRTPPLANPKRDDKPVTHYTPSAVYPYHHSDGRVIGYVLRVEIKGRKITPLVLWCENTETGELMWCHRPFTSPRRLYNLPAFAARLEAQVLVVEGEKCADAAQALLPKLVVTTWQGGGKAAGKSDWKPVNGRDVLIWPDADPEGLDAAQEAGRLATEAGARSVRVISIPADKPKGWDIADAIEAGWTKADVIGFARAGARPWGEPREEPQTAPEPPAADERRFDEPPAERDGERERLTRPALRPVAQEKPQPEPEGKPEDEPLPDNVRPIRPNVRPILNYDWRKNIQMDQHNKPIKKLMTNLIVYLRDHPDMVGCIRKDVFSNKIMLMTRPPWDHEGDNWEPREMLQGDFTSAVAWLDGPRLDTNVSNVTSAVTQIAHAQRFDPAREYFESLEWDGVPRLWGEDGGPGWLEKYVGIRPTKHGIERAFGARILIATVARNLTDRPAGEKVDNMLIIEGKQGFKKSTVVETLATVGGNRWYTNGVADIRSKDGLLQMRGCLFVELDELAALGKSDAEKIKSFVSTQQDDIRPPYGRTVEKMPRRFVLIGTMNPRGMGYLPDSTGNRRFWPVLSDRPADIEALARDRDQLWAEAVANYHAGEPWWLQGDEVERAEAEQRKRFQSDAWADDLDDYLATIVGTDVQITLKQVFSAINIPMRDRNAETQARVTNHITQAGWVRGVAIRDGARRTVFRRPANG